MTTKETKINVSKTVVFDNQIITEISIVAADDFGGKFSKAVEGLCIEALVARKAKAEAVKEGSGE